MRTLFERAPNLFNSQLGMRPTTKVSINPRHPPSDPSHRLATPAYFLCWLIRGAAPAGFVS
ncbi:hypothetical protein BC827DRAFT_419499 [Russula dissimulans]|nr:hypothetical protein BC827DRAFT_419499 [Russula dissimulans]